MRWLFGVAAALVLALTAAPASAQQGAAVLSPSMICSACEITAREIYRGYNTTSANGKFVGTEIELAEILDAACTRVGRYRLAQEAFGAHMKVFADPTEKYDVQNIEKPEYYSPGDKEAYESAMPRLYGKCLEFVGLVEDDVSTYVKDRVDEKMLREHMCLDVTNVCTPEALAEYKARESRRRRKWKIATREAREAKRYAEWASQLNSDEEPNTKEL